MCLFKFVIEDKVPTRAAEHCTRPGVNAWVIENTQHIHERGWTKESKKRTKGMVFLVQMLYDMTAIPATDKVAMEASEGT
jgi:hypothetical protein